VNSLPPVAVPTTEREGGGREAITQGGAELPAKAGLDPVPGEKSVRYHGNWGTTEGGKLRMIE